MSEYKSILGQICIRCQQQMDRVSEQIVNGTPMLVFHCDTCDKYSAALLSTNGVPTGLAPSLVTGL